MMTALALVNKGSASICHQFIKILDQKILFYSKIPAFNIRQVHISIAPDNKFLVAFRVNPGCLISNPFSAISLAVSNQFVRIYN
jgi:hypothetical protein